MNRRESVEINALKAWQPFAEPVQGPAQIVLGFKGIHLKEFFDNGMPEFELGNFNGNVTPKFWLSKYGYTGLNPSLMFNNS